MPKINNGIRDAASIHGSPFPDPDVVAFWTLVPTPVLGKITVPVGTGAGLVGTAGEVAVAVAVDVAFGVTFSVAVDVAVVPGCVGLGVVTVGVLVSTVVGVLVSAGVVGVSVGAVVGVSVGAVVGVSVGTAGGHP